MLADVSIGTCVFPNRFTVRFRFRVEGENVMRHNRRRDLEGAGTLEFLTARNNHHPNINRNQKPSR